jgi:hypothetical protein
VPQAPFADLAAANREAAAWCAEVNGVVTAGDSFWLLGFLLRAAETVARPRRRRWYYW